MWLVVVGSSLTTITGTSGASIGPTKHCINVKLEEYIGLAVATPFLNDTCVFIATTYRLMHFGLPGDAGIRDTFRAVISGNGLTLLTKALFHDGQAYYMWVLSQHNAAVYDIDWLPQDYVRPYFDGLDSFLYRVNSNGLQRQLPKYRRCFDQYHGVPCISKD